MDAVYLSQSYSDQHGTFDLVSSSRYSKSAASKSTRLLKFTNESKSLKLKSRIDFFFV